MLLDDKLNIQPLLAESWQISKDGKTYTFNLRHDVKWHDGKPFTSADVKFTFDTILNPQINSPQRSKFSAIKSVETPDSYTVRFVLS